MMALKCDVCREVAVCLLCECTTPPISVCQCCLAQHLEDSTGEHSQVSPGADADCLCSRDGMQAYHFCVCNEYVCGSCMSLHHPPREEHHVYPITLLPVFHQDSTGSLLRRGELLDKLMTAWQEQTSGLRPRLVKKVADTFDSLQKLLQESREKALAQVIKYAKEFESESVAIVEKLKSLKYKIDWQPDTELEEIIQREDTKALSELQSSVADWTFELEEFQKKWESLSRLKNWKYLLKAPAQEPCCFAVANGKTQVLALPSLQPLTVPPHLAELDGSLLCLPSTEWFFCDTTSCSLITPDFSSQRNLCTLNVSRRESALAYYHNCVYIFGGHSIKGVSSTAECVDLDSRSSRTLACPLPITFFGVAPCRHEDTLYFGCVLFYQGGYIFHIPTERFDHLSIHFDSAGLSIAMSFPNDEIVFLSYSGLYTFLLQGKEGLKLAEGTDTNYNSETVPVRQQGIWYFIGVSDNVKVICAMEETDKEIRHVGVIEKPVDFLQQLLARGFNLNRSSS